MKHLIKLNWLTVSYVTSLSWFMGWYVALFWEDCRCFCCSSQNNLMKGEIFLWSVSKKVYLNSLLKSTLTGKHDFDISSRSCPSFILSFLFFIRYLWIVNFWRSEEACEIEAFVFAGLILFSFLIKSFLLEFLKLSFSLSI